MELINSINSQAPKHQDIKRVSALWGRVGPGLSWQRNPSPPSNITHTYCLTYNQQFSFSWREMSKNSRAKPTPVRFYLQSRLSLKKDGCNSLCWVCEASCSRQGAPQKVGGKKKKNSIESNKSCWGFFFPKLICFHYFRNSSLSNYMANGKHT